MAIHIRPSIRLRTLPSTRPYADRFRLAAAAGFEGLEVQCAPDQVAEIREAVDLTGLPVHSICNGLNRKYPLTSGDPATLATAIERAIRTLEDGARLGVETMLVDAGKVEDGTSYCQAYDRAQAVIRNELLPAARELGIVLAIENVWNGFLLSPLEYVRFIDELESPFARAYIDVGNVIFGRPENWIEIAGTRTVKLHLKDFRFRPLRGRFRWTKIGDGDVDWTRVRAALDAVGYSGWGVFAEAENVQNRVARRIYHEAQFPRRAMAALPGSRPVFGLAQTFLARRLLNDVMARHRRHIGP